VNLGPNINSPEQDSAPSISSDNLALIFRSNRPGKYSSEDYPDLWLTTRRTTFDSWREPINLGPEINTDDVDLATISPDGQTLYLTCYIRSGGIGWYDIWEAPVIPVVDLNVDGNVDAEDMFIMAKHWGQNYSLCDIGPMPWGDGLVNVQDLLVLAEHLSPVPVAHWKLDETEGMYAADSVGENNAIVVGGATWQPSGGQIDGAIQLDGLTGCAITNPVLNPADGPFSIFTWVRGGAPGQVIVSQQSAANWLTVGADGDLMTELKGAGRSTGPLFAEAVITDGQWHRIGLVWDGTNRTLCVDGIAVAEDTQPGLDGSTMGLYIGVDKNYTAGTFFSGLIDDVRIYDRALTADEITTLAQSSLQ
jgi:hypothetical protein